MCSAYVWPRSVQGQGHNLRFNVWLYFVSALYLLNPWWDLQITAQMSSMMRQCAVPRFDQCLFKVKAQFKIKHCMTVFGVRSISFEPLVVFTNNFTWLQLKWDDVQCLCLTKVSWRSRSKFKISPVPCGYSSPSVIALVYDFTFLYKFFWFHPVTYGGRHDCFRFWKHPSSFST